MKNFLYKEFKLCLAPINYIYLCFAFMAFIPNYPRYVSLFFYCVSVLHLFNNALLNKDIEYSMILPITKKDIVKSRCLLVCGYQIAGILLTIPFSILYTFFGPTPNAAGIEGNVAFYGLGLILLSTFNITFFTHYYKKAEKPGAPFLLASVIFWIGFSIMEMPIWLKDVVNVPYFKIMDQTDGASLIKQLPILGGGIIFYIVFWVITYKVSAKRFERVDL